MSDNPLQHDMDLIAAAVEPWRTDCSTPVFQMVRNAVAEVDILRQRCRKAELEGGWAVDPTAYVEREKYEAALRDCVSALDGLLGDSDLPDDDRPGVLAMQRAMALLNGTRV